MKIRNNNNLYMKKKQMYLTPKLFQLPDVESGKSLVNLN